MKNIIIIACTILSVQVFAQDKEHIIPFTNPNEAKELDLQIFSADITIKGSTRSDVLIKYRIEENKDGDHLDETHRKSGEVPEKAKGMKKIGGNNFEFEISEKNNRVRVKSQNFMNLLVMEIEAPKEIAINLSKQIGENIVVQNITGDVNVETQIGNVTVNNVSGIVNASSSTGSILVNFDAIPDPQTMTFNTITGDIDLTFPSNYKADLKMKTEWGDVYSDMDIETRLAEENDTQTREKDGNLRVISNSWTLGSLNGGGPEMTLKSQMGSIYLRKK